MYTYVFIYSPARRVSAQSFLFRRPRLRPRTLRASVPTTCGRPSPSRIEGGPANKYEYIHVKSELKEPYVAFDIGKSEK